MNEIEKPCLICGADPAVRACFIPDNPSLYGAPRGKTRLFPYSLCQRCMERPDKASVVEKIIWSEFGQGGCGIGTA